MDVTRVRDILEMCGGRMTVFGGIMGFESFVEGAEGWVAVGSNILPAASAKLFTLTADDEDYHAARALYREILPIIRLVGGHRYVSGSKAALALIGHAVGGPAPPRLPLARGRNGRGQGALIAVACCPSVWPDMALPFHSNGQSRRGGRQHRRGADRRRRSDARQQPQRAPRAAVLRHGHLPGLPGDRRRKARAARLHDRSAGGHGGAAQDE